jgi:O-antigen ligase
LGLVGTALLIAFSVALLRKAYAVRQDNLQMGYLYCFLFLALSMANSVNSFTSPYTSIVWVAIGILLSTADAKVMKLKGESHH